MSSGINWDGGGIPDAAHLRTLPDGTIISWLRIIGDPTSEAVAFVRREVTNESGFPTVDVWISPGGWDPQTIESAGVTFPAHVVRLGEFNPEHYLGAELPLLSETLANGDGGYLTSEEVARKLRRSPKTIRRFVAAGMPAYKVRGRLFFDPAEVDAWLRDRGDQAKHGDHRAVIRALVDAAPELTDEQVAKIRGVLGGAR